MLNFPDNPTVDQEFRVNNDTMFKWTAAPDRWKRIVAPPIDPLVTFLDPHHGLVNTAHPINVWGQGFTAGCKVFLTGQELATTFISDVELRCTMPASATPGPTPVWVVMDGLTTLPPTAGLPFTYDPIPLVLSSLNPGSFMQQAGIQNGVMQLHGSGFNPNCFAMNKGFLSPLTYVSPTQMTSNNMDLRTAGTFPIYVTDTQIGTNSNELNYYITSNQPPSITSVSPNTAPQGSTIALLTVTGVNLVNGKRIVLDGFPVATTYVNATTLTTPNVPAKASYKKIVVTVEDTPGTLNVTLTPLPNSVEIGEVLPDIWPHSHQTNPYYGRNFLVYPGGYSDSDEVWICDSAAQTPNWILHDSWPENGALMFQCSYLGRDPMYVTQADVMVKKNGVQTGNTARLLIGGYSTSRK